MLSKGGSSSRPSLPLLRISMTSDGLCPAVNADKPTMHCFAMESDPAVAVFSSCVSVCCHFLTLWFKDKIKGKGALKMHLFLKPQSQKFTHRSI